MSGKYIGWFSCGVTSAVAIKIAIDKYGCDNVLPIYFKIDQCHDDNERFIRECEEWYGVKIAVMQGKYRTPIEVADAFKYVNGPYGARCTMELKKALRYAVEADNAGYLGQVFGFEYTPREVARSTRFSEQYPNAKPIFPLIDEKITKPEAMYMLERAGIHRPAMYDLGYSNNNCIGCLKGSAGYWNKIRIDFPDIFKATAEMERRVGATCLKRKYLDELSPTAGRRQKIILPDCGNFCDIEEV